MKKDKSFFKIAPKEVIATIEKQEEAFVFECGTTSIRSGRVHKMNDKIYLGTISKHGFGLGWGQNIYHDGSIYVGYLNNYKSLCKVIFGTMTWSDGSRYSG